jgi:hypothetical protein
MELRFNHMEITFPKGTLTPEFRADVAAFYGDVFGFSTIEDRMFGQDAQLMTLPTGDFILLIEGDDEMRAPGFDHLGFEMGTYAEVDETLAKVRSWCERDDRVQLKEYDDGVMHGRTYHAYYVRHLLPIWFDVQFSEAVATV